MNYIPGAGRDLEQLIRTHLFVVCPNNSGSSFLAAALGKCQATWRLPREGQFIRGFVGPVTTGSYGHEQHTPALLWASERKWLDLFAEPARYDWARSRKAWYFHARAHAADASVFVTKSPPHVLHVGQLARAFRNARFLFMVRNPYAVCEGICRRYRTRLVRDFRRQFTEPGKSVEEAAAVHVVNCLAWQRRNIEMHSERSVFFTYEDMCDEPAAMTRKVQSLVPELDDLRLRQRIAVKNYDEPLTNMNERQIAALSGEEIAAFNRVFHKYRDTLSYFGYDLMDSGGRSISLCAACDGTLARPSAT